MASYQMRNSLITRPSLHRDKTLDPPKGFSIAKSAKKIYDKHAKMATRDLVEFVGTLAAPTPQMALLVTYFDEAHELGLSFWILLRLLTNQDRFIRMWYVFMGTKSKVSFFNPAPNESG